MDKSIMTHRMLCRVSSPAVMMVSPSKNIRGSRLPYKYSST